MSDREDDDWGIGSFDRVEAERMVIRNLDIHPDGYIAVIDEGDGTPISKICVDEITPDDFTPIYYHAANIIRAHDWEEAADDLNSLADRLDMKKEWEKADGDTFENLIREMSKKIGVDLID